MSRAQPRLVWSMFFSGRDERESEKENERKRKTRWKRKESTQKIWRRKNVAAHSVWTLSFSWCVYVFLQKYLGRKREERARATARERKQDGCRRPLITIVVSKRSSLCCFLSSCVSLSRPSKGNYDVHGDDTLMDWGNIKRLVERGQRLRTAGRRGTLRARRIDVSSNDHPPARRYHDDSSGMHMFLSLIAQEYLPIDQLIPFDWTWRQNSHVAVWICVDVYIYPFRLVASCDRY